MRFLQGKRIKVSLFLQQNLQTMNGVLVLSNAGPLPYGTETPGSKKLYEDGRMVNKISFSTPATLEGLFETSSVLDLSSSLGNNMYVTDHASDSKSVPESIMIANSALSGTYERGDDGLKKPVGAKLQGITSSSAKKELTLLADLLGISGQDKKYDDEKPFRFNLFPDLRFEGKEEHGGKDDGSNGFIMVDLDGTAGGKTFDEYLKDLDLKDTKTSHKIDDDEDLLSLMDSAK